MKKTNLLITILFVLLTQLVFAQDSHKRISIKNPSESTLLKIATSGIDLNCGSNHSHNDLILDLTDEEVNLLASQNITYKVVIDDLEKFYSDRAIKTQAKANAELNAEKFASINNSNTMQRASISSVAQDNIIQYINCDEIDWVTPQNFNLGSMGGCLTLSEMKSELDEMRAYSVINGLDIVSQKLDASPTGQTTWGNPSGTISNNGLTYSGQGTSRWNPETIYYVRITGNESSTPENTKPQILFTSMIHSREVSALMNNIYFMWYLIENYNTNDAVKELVDNNELYFVPVVNPDGLRWNEHLNSNGGGMQRKNLRPNTGGTTNTTTTRGVDLNRNFDYYWGYNNIGSSGTQTSGTYRGPSPSSEPETQIMEDFILSRNFETGVWNHSFANSVPHPYGGVPTLNSGREDEFYRWHEEMTRYNRYLYGATIFYESNGLPDDWMLGGAPDNNGHTGSGQAILATTPEHGSEGFWPPQTSIIPIAKRSMRISFGTAYYGGKYAKLHDLTQSNIDNTTSYLDFGIERIGQTASDFTLTITPISSNIISINTAPTQTGINVLEQRHVSAQIQLNPSIVANEKIEYNVKLSNDNGIIYDVNYEKYYQPTVLFDHDPDVDGISGWTQSGGWTTSSTDTYTGTNALITSSGAPYSNNTTRTLTTTNSYDFSNSTSVVVQFYSKWDIERNYDFVEILGSTNGGSSWQPLCGKYTKPNATSNTTTHDNKGGSSNFQANSMGQVYDGDRMDNWVMEEIAIDAANNSYLLGATNVKFRFNFRTDGSNVSENYTTTSDGYFIDDFKIISIQIPCQTDVPVNVSTSSITATEATVTWDAIPSATYDLRYRVSGSSTWIDVLDVITSSYTITSLQPTTTYEVEVRSKCDTATSTYSSTINFTTTDVNYCNSNGQSTADEYIGNVTLNTINNNSNAGTTSTGYSDFTYITTDLDKNLIHNISVSKTWTGTQYNEAVSVWIDFNKDGDFDDTGENVFTSGPSQSTPVNGNFSIPISAVIGSTRMRVSMKYNSSPTSCESFQYGEVEDYTVNITEPSLSNNEFSINDVKIYPNPFNDSFSISLPSSLTSNELEISIYDMRGRLIIKENPRLNNYVLTINNLNSVSNGSYFVRIKDVKTQKTITKKLIKQ